MGMFTRWKTWLISVSSADSRDGIDSLNTIMDKPECQTGQSFKVTGDTSPACILISSSHTLPFCQVLQPLTPPHAEKPLFPIKPADRRRRPKGSSSSILPLSVCKCVSESRSSSKNRVTWTWFQRGCGPFYCFARLETDCGAVLHLLSVARGDDITLLSSLWKSRTL